MLTTNCSRLMARLPISKYKFGLARYSDMHRIRPSLRNVYKGQMYKRTMLFRGKTVEDLICWEPYYVDKFDNRHRYARATVLTPGNTIQDLRIFNDKELVSKIRNECRQIKTFPMGPQIVSVAINHNYIGGKWMIFISEKQVNRVWQDLARRAVEGSLPGGIVMVSLTRKFDINNPRIWFTTERSASGELKQPKAPVQWERKINIRVQDFTCPSIKFEMKQLLRQLNFKGKVYLKPDIYTLITLDCTSHSIRPTIIKYFVNGQNIKEYINVEAV